MYLCSACARGAKESMRLLIVCAQTPPVTTFVTANHYWRIRRGAPEVVRARRSRTVDGTVHSLLRWHRLRRPSLTRWPRWCARALARISSRSHARARLREQRSLASLLSCP